MTMEKSTKCRPRWDGTVAGPQWHTDRWRLPVTRWRGLVLYVCFNGRNTQIGETVLPIANLIADSELGHPDSYSSFLVNIGLSRLVSEIFARDRQTDGENANHYYSWPHIVAGELIKRREKWRRTNYTQASGLHSADFVLSQPKRESLSAVRKMYEIRWRLTAAKYPSKLATQ